MHLNSKFVCYFVSSHLIVLLTSYPFFPTLYRYYRMEQETDIR